MAEQERVPRKFLEAIFVQLRDQGIIESRRGAQGGYPLCAIPFPSLLPMSFVYWMDHLR